MGSDRRGRVLILGASVRAAAFSAVRAGFSPWCVDLFADADLQACCPARRLPGRYPRGFLEVIDEGGEGPWLYTGGLENHPRLVDELAKRRRLWGNAGAVLRRGRDPKMLAEAAREAGLPAPRQEHYKGSSKWLVKPRFSAGGAGIQEWEGEPLSRRQYLQEYVEGPSASAVFVGREGGAVLLGMTTQLVGEPFLHAPRFRYCGSMGPVKVGRELEKKIERLGNVLVGRAGLRGLFGVDGILREGEFWPIEVNPRYTASVEVLEKATGLQALQWHAAAFGGAKEPGEVAWKGEEVEGKAILYARAALVIPELGNIADIADLPHPGEQMLPGQPILTVFARGRDEGSCLAELRTRAAALERVLYAGG